MVFELIKVDCYNGYRAGEKPVSFTFRDRRWEITEIVDRWYEGGVKAGRSNYNYFKVLTAEGEVFILRYNCRFDTWAIQIA